MRGLVCLFALTGCLGEGGVDYLGSVNDSDVSAHQFSTVRDQRSPIEGAKVELLLDGNVVDETTTSVDGVYPQLSMVFPWVPGHDHVIEVRATAPDGRTYTYRTVYEETKDPTSSIIVCKPDRPCELTLLAFTLAR